MPKNLLVIAGSSPDSGAGVQIDLKVSQSIGIRAVTAITCLTSQNTTGVKGVENSSSLGQQLISILEDIPVHAVKIGVVPNPSDWKIILDLCKDLPIILDPVMVAEADTFSFVKENELLLEAAKKSLFITPNLIETKRMIGIDPSFPSSALSAADRFISLGVKSGAIKGIDHGPGLISDLFFSKESRRFFIKKRTPFRYHGSGCCFASAVASYYCRTFDLETSVLLTEDFVAKAILRAKRIGKGEVLVVMP